LSATDSTQRSTTSTSFVTASNTLSVTITPSSASNKILLILSSTGHIGNHTTVHYTIYRGATNLGNGASGMTNIYWANGASIETPISMTYLDSPSTTSAITYQVYMKVNFSTGYLNMNGAIGSLTCLEIKG